MSKYQRGDTVIVVFFIAMGLIAATLIGMYIWRAVVHQEHIGTYNAWSSQCYREGGFVHDVRYGRSECFIDGKKTVLKGWEKYAE